MRRIVISTTTPQHKESALIIQELKGVTDVLETRRALITFRGSSENLKELQWTSIRIATLHEDIASCSLFGIIGGLFISYLWQSPLSRLLQSLISANLFSYDAPTMLPSLFKDEMQTSAFLTQDIIGAGLVSMRLYRKLNRLSSMIRNLPACIALLAHKRRRCSPDRLYELMTTMPR
jgi:hypothetical protein